MNLTVLDFLLHKTQVGELCIIRDRGWISQAVYIDHEDLCVLVTPQYSTRTVMADSFENMVFTRDDGYKQTMQVHMIDI